MKFSVVIPNHNGAATLGEVLRAVRAAAPVGTEVIVADDASSDGSEALAGEFGAGLVRSPVCRGAAPTRNLGAAAASGEILVFLDSDVVVPPGTFEILEGRFRDPEVAGVIGLLKPVTRFGNLCSQYKNYYMHYTYLKLPERVSVFYTSLAAVRVSVFRELGGFDEAYRSATIEDLEFGIRLSRAGRVLLIDKRLQVDHIRRYGLKSLLLTAFRRASGATKIALRRRLDGDRRSYVTTSLPFLGGIGVVFAAPVLLATALIRGSLPVLALAASAALGAALINAGFLLGLARHTRKVYFFSGAALLLLDLAAHGCGNLHGLFTFARGRRY